jgi:hypothetical protein
MTGVPRLLALEDAKEYLGGLDPAKLLDPVPLPCRRRFWDRKALDKALDALSHLDDTPANAGWSEQALHRQGKGA